MKTEKNINVEMYKVENSPAPFIKVDYMDKYGGEQTGLLLLDSGANVNVLSIEYDFSHLKNESDVYMVSASSNGVLEKTVRFSFTLDDVQFEDDFIVKGHLFNDYHGDIPLIGVIGSVFLHENDWVIDYSNHTIYTSTTKESGVDVYNCQYYFPMTQGLNGFGMPTVPLVQGKWEVAAAVHTGVMENYISSSTLGPDGLQCDYVNYESLALFMSKCIDNVNMRMDYGLLTVIDKAGHTGEVTFSGGFLVSRNPFYTPDSGVKDDNGKPLEPVEAIIGASFVEKEGWILDFGIDMIYKFGRNEAVKELAS